MNSVFLFTCFELKLALNHFFPTVYGPSDYCTKFATHVRSVALSEFAVTITAPIGGPPTAPPTAPAAAPDSVMAGPGPGRHLARNPYSIVCQAYIRYMPEIFQVLTYARYIPGIYLSAKSSVFKFIGFNACIPGHHDHDSSCIHTSMQPVPKAYRKRCVKCKMKCSDLNLTQMRL